MEIFRRMLVSILVLFMLEVVSAQKLLIPEQNSFQGKFLHYPIAGPGADISTTRLFFDSKGFLWAGTFNALYRYDGNSYKSYGFRNLDSTALAGSFVSCIYEDSSGVMWIGTYGALNRLEQKTGMISQFMPDSGNYISPDNRIRSFRVDRTGLFWLITCGDVFTFNKTTLKFKKYSVEGLASFSWSEKSGQFLEDSGGNIWIVSQNGLNRYSPTEDRFICYRHDPADPRSISCNNVSGIIEDHSGTLWCSTSGGGLNRIVDPVGGVFEKVRFRSEKRLEAKLDTLSTLFSDFNGTIWIFGNRIFATYSPLTGEMKSYMVKPVNEMFRNFRGHNLLFEEAFQLNENSIWFYQIQGLVFKFEINSEKLTIYAVPNWIVLDYLIDKSGSVWFGCANGNTWRLVLNDLPYQSVQVYNMFNVATCNNPRIVEDPERRIWLALSTGLFRAEALSENSYFNPKKIKLPIEDTVATCLIKDRSGNLWAALKKNRVVRINSINNLYKTFYLPEQIEDIIFNIIEDQHGNLWFLSFNKIFVLYSGSEQIRKFSVEGKLLNEILKEGIFDVLIDSGDNMWFASFGDGVYSYNLKNKSVIKYLSETGTELLTGDFCIRIKEDSGKRIWVLFGSKGLYQLDRETGKLFPVRLMDILPVGITFSDLIIDKKNVLTVYHNYGLTIYNPDTDSLRQISFSQQAGSYCSCQLSTGQVLSLSGSELKLFRDTIPYNNAIPEVYFTGLKINDNDYSRIYPEADDLTSLNKIKLSHRQNNLLIEFTALNFLFPENNRYRYYMSGIDNDTVFLNNYHSIEYKKIRPGNYTFWFTGSNNDGVWNPSGKKLEIHIRPPLSRSLFAFVFYGICFLLLIGVYTKRHFRKLITDKKRLENEVHLRTVELEKKNQQIEEMDRLKTRFFTEISHEIRTPLSLIIGPIDNLIGENGRLEESRRLSLMDMIRRNGMRLLNLVNQLLDITRIDAGKMKITLAESDILKSLRILVHEYLSMAESRKISYNVEISGESYITLFDKDKIEKIVSNLLSNAFKFTPSYGTVTCRIDIRDSWEQKVPAFLSILVKDTGVGINKEDLGKIFDRFYRVEGEWEKDGRGTGIGLSLTEEFVSLLHGTIHVSSEKDAGSTFAISIPLGKEHLSPDEYVIVKAHPFQEQLLPEHEPDHQAILKEKETEDGSNKPQLLIIEDNQDLRDFFRENLSEEYHIYEAENGRRGITVAFAKIPDLVVTDIVMPDLDGIELCKRLKHDERTSHIPVIILTARTSSDDKIEGLVTGADDYITKPFDIKELKIRISNLLIQREKLRHKYGLFTGNEKTEGLAASIDENFMRKINLIVLENINRFDFDVAALQEKSGISRVQLYRKLKALTGLSPSSLIHNQRMFQAARLIHNKAGNLTEISLSVGFSNPSYFSKCFKNFFGISPRDFIHHPEEIKKVMSWD